MVVLQTKSAQTKSDAALKLPKTPLFGTDGIRGKAGELLTPELALKIGYITAEVLEESAATCGPVILGQDSRNSSEMLSMALAAGLTSSGVEVWNVGLCPTPCVAYLTRVTNAVGGIMISASHNPPEDNGIKVFNHKGTKLSKFDTSKIEARLRAETNGEREYLYTEGKHYHRPYLIKNYVESLVCSLPSEKTFKGMRIVLDLAWGAAAKLAPSVFKALGAEVICLHDLPDGDRINVNCGSTHLDKLKATVVASFSDIGFAFDGDADRVIAVDKLGRVVDGDYILYLWGKHLKEQNQLPENLIIATVMANLGFEQAWRNLGGKLMRTSVGDHHVQEQMWHSGAMLGGEQSGHILCHHHSVSGDGLQTALHLTSLVRQSGTSLAKLVDQSFVTYPQILQNVRVENRDRCLDWQNCEAVQKAIASASSAMGNDGRVLVRASGTEPVIRVMVEAICLKSATYWTDKLVNTVRENLAV